MLCQQCQAALQPDINAALARVRFNRKPWAGSPPNWIGGPWGDLQTLISAGMAKRDAAGWCIATPLYLALHGHGVTE